MSLQLQIHNEIKVTFMPSTNWLCEAFTASTLSWPCKKSHGPPYRSLPVRWHTPKGTRGQYNNRQKGSKHWKSFCSIKYSRISSCLLLTYLFFLRMYTWMHIMWALSLAQFIQSDKEFSNQAVTATAVVIITQHSDRPIHVSTTQWSHRYNKWFPVWI
jgi:hypothetical protein